MTVTTLSASEMLFLICLITFFACIENNVFENKTKAVTIVTTLNAVLTSLNKNSNNVKIKPPLCGLI